MGLEPLPEDDNHIVTHWCGNGIVSVHNGKPEFCDGCRVSFGSSHIPFRGEFTIWAKETEVA